MLSVEQIRAARALLDWSQTDLADHAGLSQTGIARIENGTNQPNTKTLKKIEQAFDIGGVEFLGTTGVQLRTNQIVTYSGGEGFRTFMNDVYNSCKSSDKMVCIFNGMPNKMIEWLGTDWYKSHADRMYDIKDQFDFKVIVKENEKKFIGRTFAEYKWFPENLFHEQMIYVYGNKLAFLYFEEGSADIQVINDASIADSFRVLFSIAWDKVAAYTNGSEG